MNSNCSQCGLVLVSWPGGGDEPTVVQLLLLFHFSSFKIQLSLLAEREKRKVGKWEGFGLKRNLKVFFAKESFKKRYFWHGRIFAILSRHF